MGQVVGIRADANDEIAMGHMMRCITIAVQLKKLGQSPLFFTADRYAHELLKQAGMEYVCLNTSWKDMGEEIGRLREELVKAGCAKLLVDSYQATPEYFDKIRDICKIIYIDDCFEDVYPVDMVINYNAYHVRFPYEQTYKGKAELLLGTEYVPLREEFQRTYGHGKGKREKENAAGVGGKFSEWLEIFDRMVDRKTGKFRIFLSSGGGDVCDALSGILSSAAREKTLNKAVFHVVVGKFNRNKDKLERLAKKNPNIRLHYSVNNMAKLMGQCDIAVSAAGTVLFELCAMQIPAVFFVCADNQQYDSEFFARKERMLFAGDIRQDRKGCLGQIQAGLKILMRDMPMRKRMKKALCQVTDGQGAARIAEKIKCL